MNTVACTDPIHMEKRKHPRYCIPSVVTCRFFKDFRGGKRNFPGFVQDISLGGVFLEIRDDSHYINESGLEYSALQMTLECNLPDGLEMMAVSGTIKWHKRIKKTTGNFLYLRIQFHTLDERSLETLREFLYQGTGDKRLFWSLWDTMKT